jgi:tRNA 2-thiouridine synthesizing protein A
VVDSRSKPEPVNDEQPQADAMITVLGASCAVITPRIREELAVLQSGDVLEVRADDPSAREGVPAWSRLTGNELIGTVEEDDQATRFFIRKK